mmetsp:Transcript_104702/g.254130  ORF Transcript_104702/g.254130 Transcript_104702/m.254130 type:complete len:352 (+) Transcript_104702:1078-2133(+)
MRARPSFSWEVGPSRTSMISSTSAVRKIFAEATSNSSVMAIAFTTLKYCCRKARNFLLLTPSASTCLQRSRACSGDRDRPSKDCKCWEKASSEMRSSPGLSSSSKSPSFVRPLLCTSALSAAAARPHRPSAMDWQAPRAASREPAAFFWAAAAFNSSFCSSRLRSTNGPLTALPTFAICSSLSALASPTLARASAERSSACRSVEAGVAKSSSSAPFRDTRGLISLSSCLRLASMASIFVAMSAEMTAAAFFSLISMCASLSSCSFLGNSFLAMAAFFFSCSRLPVALVTFSRSFTSSALASAIGAGFPACASSVLLALKKAETSLALFTVSSIFLSISSAKVLNGETASM